MSVITSWIITNSSWLIFLSELIDKKKPIQWRHRPVLYAFFIGINNVVELDSSFKYQGGAFLLFLCIISKWLWRHTFILMPIRIINIPVIYISLDIGLENWFFWRWRVKTLGLKILRFLFQKMQLCIALSRGQYSYLLLSSKNLPIDTSNNLSNQLTKISSTLVYCTDQFSCCKKRTIINFIVPKWCCCLWNWEKKQWYPTVQYFYTAHSNSRWESPPKNG